jgi:hypothetical protein
MKTKTLFAIAAAALVVAALVGVTYAQFVGAQNPTTYPTTSQTVPPYLNGNTANNPAYCYNGTTTTSGYGCYSYAASQQTTQHPCGMGMMGQTGRSMMGSTGL